MAPKKKVSALIKLQIQAGKANRPRRWARLWVRMA